MQVLNTHLLDLETNLGTLTLDRRPAEIIFGSVLLMELLLLHVVIVWHLLLLSNYDLEAFHADLRH